MITVEYTVWCDGELDDGIRCHQWDTVTGRARVAARASAKEMGWHRWGTRDYCSTDHMVSAKKRKAS